MDRREILVWQRPNRISFDYAVVDAPCKGFSKGAMKAKLVSLIPMAALAAALLDLPYGYYVLLRLLVCGVCIYLAAREREDGRNTWVWLLGGCAVLYNPIFRIHLNRDIWSVVNIATIGLFAVHMWSASRRSMDRAPNQSKKGNSTGFGP